MEEGNARKDEELGKGMSCDKPGQALQTAAAAPVGRLTDSKLWPEKPEKNGGSSWKPRCLL